MSFKEVDLPVVGMSCTRCAANVERVLQRKVDGVESASVNFAAETAHISYDPDKVGLPTIAEAVKEAGFSLVLPESHRHAEIPVVGMSCTVARQTWNEFYRKRRWG